MTSSLQLTSDKTVEKWKATPRLVKVFAAGSLSGCCSSILFQPLDLIKTRLQAVPNRSITTAMHCSPSAAIIRGASKSSFSVIRLVQQEHFFGLWKGLAPTLYRTVPGVGMYFATLQYMKSFVRSEPTFYENLAMGFSARVFASIVLLPATVVKARFESGRFHYNSVPSALLSIWRVEGTRGLFSGATATIARDAPYSGLYLMFYQNIKQITTEALGPEVPPTFKHWISGILAGLMASVVTMPADVVKTNMQLDPQRYGGSTLRCARTLVHENGVSVLFRGMVPRVARRTLICALSWTVFEEVMRTLNLKV